MDTITRNWIIGGIIAVIIVVGGVYLLQKQENVSPASVDISKVSTVGDPFIGSGDAPVTIIFWSDYQCTFCKSFELDTVSKIVSEYVASGKVRIIFKDFAFLGDDSATASLLGRAVWQVAPDKFYQWHSAMFEKQDAENLGWGNKADILSLTKSLGIDFNKVDTLAMDNVALYQKVIDENKTEATAIGVQGTPAMVIGKQLIYGAKPYADVKLMIEAQLNNK